MNPEYADTYFSCSSIAEMQLRDESDDEEDDEEEEDDDSGEAEDGNDGYSE